MSIVKRENSLTVTEDDLLEIVAHIRRIAEEPDPTGETSQAWLTQEGLHVHRVRVPIGVIAVISEYGPSVVAESMAMCLRSGNVCVVRGGKEWFLDQFRIGEGLA